MRRLSPPVAGLLLGLLTGLADAAYVIQEPGGVSAAAVAAVIWTWSAIGCATGVVFNARCRGVAMMATCPALLLLARAAIPFRQASGWSSSTVLLAWGAVTLLLCAVGALMRFRETTRRGRWRIAAAVGLALAMLWAADFRVPRASARESVSGLKPAPHNVALIVLDTARYDDTMAAAPHIAAFARTAVTFDNAWSPGAWTVPSHFAMFTGRDPWTVPFDREANRYQYGGTWLAGHFRSRGYATGAVFANNRLTDHEGYGRDFQELTYSRQSGVCRSGIGYLLGYSSRYTQRHPPLCERMDAAEVVGRARDFVRRAGRPYFLALNFTDPHEPYVIAPECRPFEPVPHAQRRTVVLATPRRRPDPAVAARVRAQYRAAIACMDRSIATLLQDLDDGHTVIAIVADHGEEFGEHAFGGHGLSVHQQVVHVPLILKVPDVAPARLAEAVSSSDLYASLIRAADPVRARAPVTLFDARRRRPAVASFAGGYGIARGNLHLIRLADGRELLFDLAADPDERRPLPIPNDSNLASMRQVLLRAARQQQRRVEFEALGYLR